MDIEAIRLAPEHRVVTISSAGCNALSYLTVGARQIDVVDLNSTHLALLELKIAAARTATSYGDFVRFFGEARDGAKVVQYDRGMNASLSQSAREYWDSRIGLRGTRRIEMFRTRFYRRGLLGQFIGFARAYASLRGIDLRIWSRLETETDRHAWFERDVAPAFDSRMVKWLCRWPVVLYHLGIPPRQYMELCEGDPGAMHRVLKERARALLTIGAPDRNYFAWQATTGGYRPGGPYPPYLEATQFDELRKRLDGIHLHHIGVRDFLAKQPAQTVDRVSLRDAQDWMDDTELERLWTEIGRTARPSACVIFRTAATSWRAGTRLPAHLLARWSTDEAENLRLTRVDRSGIYGRFHVYRLRD